MLRAPSVPLRRLVHVRCGGVGSGSSRGKQKNQNARASPDCAMIWPSLLPGASPVPDAFSHIMLPSSALAPPSAAPFGVPCSFPMLFDVVHLYPPKFVAEKPLRRAHEPRLTNLGRLFSSLEVRGFSNNKRISIIGTFQFSKKSKVRQWNTLACFRFCKSESFLSS